MWLGKGGEKSKQKTSSWGLCAALSRWCLFWWEEVKKGGYDVRLERLGREHGDNFKKLKRTRGEIGVKVLFQSNLQTWFTHEKNQKLLWLLAVNMLNDWQHVS